MTREEYNGWTNYETWLIALWIDNEEFWHEESRRIAGSHKVSDGSAAQALKDWVEDPDTMMFPSDLSTAGPATDLINAALSQVNWQEIAENFASDMPNEHGILLCPDCGSKLEEENNSVDESEVLIELCCDECVQYVEPDDTECAGCFRGNPKEHDQAQEEKE